MIDSFARDRLKYVYRGGVQAKTFETSLFYNSIGQVKKNEINKFSIPTFLLFLGDFSNFFLFAIFCSDFFSKMFDKMKLCIQPCKCKRHISEEFCDHRRGLPSKTTKIKSASSCFSDIVHNAEYSK